MEDSDILLRDEVMKKLRYTNVSAFHNFFNETTDFPKPFKIGRRNAWYKADVDAWLQNRREKATGQQV